MDHLNKRIVLVTGATGGLGTAMCKELHNDGFHVIANYRNKAKADEWSAKMKSEGFNIDMYEADVTDFDSVGKMIAKIEAELGTVDTLVNNAGITRDGRFAKMSKDDWDAVISTNLTSVFNCTRHVINGMIERQFGTRKISELGGLAQKAPVLAVLLVIVALANIALPLTNAFPGEFLMFNGIFSSKTNYYLWFTIMAGMGIVLGAVYTLNMIRKVFYGTTNELTNTAMDIKWNEKLALGIIVAIIFLFGIYPQFLLNSTVAVTDTIIDKFEMLNNTLPKQ